jgi:hypothetical protein
LGSEPLDARRRVLGVRDVQPTLVSADALMHTVLGFSLHFLPLEYFNTMIFPATNESLSDPLTWDALYIPHHKQSQLQSEYFREQAHWHHQLKKP